MKYEALYLPSSNSVPLVVRAVIAVTGVLLLGSGPALAQDNRSEAERQRLFESIEWQNGPCTVSIAGVATIKVPAGYQFTGPEGAKIWNEIGQNPPQQDHGVLRMVNSFDWELHFLYEQTGYISDDEQDQLDPEAILNDIRTNTAESNKVRRERGWDELRVDGWIHPPSYDDSRNQLTWAIRVTASDHQTANHSTRLLGRSGTMSVLLLAPPELMETYIPTIKGLLSGFQFQSGETHGEFRSGDKLAKYGLSGLIVGGGTAVAAKTGLLAKLAAFFAKAGTAIVLAFVALAAWIGKLLTGWIGKLLTGKSSSTREN